MLQHDGDDELVRPSENHKIFAIEVSNIKLDIIILNYSDRIFVIITQFGKIGSLLTVRKSQATDGEAREEIYEVSTIFGEDRLEYHVAARTLAESMQTNKPILFGIALRDVTGPIVQAVRSAIGENRIW